MIGKEYLQKVNEICLFCNCTSYQLDYNDAYTADFVRRNDVIVATLTPVFLFSLLKTNDVLTRKVLLS